jgi:hypothetical protein
MVPDDGVMVRRLATPRIPGGLVTGDTSTGGRR